MSGGWSTASGRSLSAVLSPIEMVATDATRRAIHETAILFTAELTKTLSTPGRGRPRSAPKSVRRQLRSRNPSVRAKGMAYQAGNRASLPGDPPAPDSGRLRGSVFYRQVGVSANIGVAVPYARALEKGARKRNLAARPYMEPTLVRVQAIIKSKGIPNVTFTKSW